MQRLLLVVLISVTFTFLLVNSKKKVLTMQFYALDCPVSKDQVCVLLECNLKAIKRGISIINIACNLTRTLEQIYVTMKVYQKTATSMRFILDRTENVCRALAQKSSIMSLVEPYFLQYTNLELKCPAEPTLVKATNLSAYVDGIWPLLPEGSFRIDFILSGQNKIVAVQVNLKVKIGHRFIDD